LERTGYHTSGLILVALLLGFLVWFLVSRLKRATSSIRSDDRVRSARLKRVYWCFLSMAGGIIVVLAALALPASPQETEGYGMLGGMFLTPIVWIAV
jgi:hypothetical protein